MSISGEEEEEGVAAGLSAMEAEFREIDENGSWSAIYQVGPLRQNQGGNGLLVKLILSGPNVSCNAR